MTIGPEPIRSIEAISVRLGMQSSMSSTGPWHDWTNRRLVGRWTTWSVWPAGRWVIQRQDFGHPSFDLIDTGHIGGMGREKLRDGLLGSETELIKHLSRTPAHAFPKRHGFAGIISRLRHEPEPDIIRFGFLLPIEGQGHIHPVGTKEALKRPSIGMTGYCSPQGTELRNLVDNAPAHSFHAMPLQRVRDFVPQHGGQADIVLRDLEDSRKHGNFPAGQTECVHRLVVVDHGKFPLVFRFMSDFRNPFSHPLDHFIRIRVLAQPGLAQNLTVGADPKLHFLLFREEYELVSPRSRCTIATGQTAEETQRGTGPDGYTGPRCATGTEEQKGPAPDWCR